MRTSRLKTSSWIIFTVGYLLLTWAACYLGNSTYMLWKHGVEERVLVVSLAETSSTYRGGTTFYYNIELGGKRMEKAFPLQLPIGKYISVLTLPGSPDVVELGDKESSLFAIFSNQLGGTVIGLLVLSMFCFMIVMAPKSFRQLWEERPSFLGGSSAN
jgi:hypothetical protein